MSSKVNIYVTIIFVLLLVPFVPKIVGSQTETELPVEADCENLTKANKYVCEASDLVDASFFSKSKDIAIEDQPSISENDSTTPSTENTEDSESLAEAATATTGTAYLDKDLFWNKGLARSQYVKYSNGILSVNVCWINPSNTPNDRKGRELTRNAVEGTWNKHSKVRFVGWTRCPVNSKGGVRIKIADEGPRAYVGRAAHTKSVSMWLNFTFNNWSTPCKNNDKQISDITWNHCVYSIAVHEFGHTLGFFHEQDRLFHGVNYHQLSPQELKKYKQECANKGHTTATSTPASDPLLTKYDPQSVMNYCYEIYDHFAPPSIRDREGIKEAYNTIR